MTSLGATKIKTIEGYFINFIVSCQYQVQNTDKQLQ